jgi:ATP-dependent Lon protease
VSSKAGRIVNILQQADCVDPVIILDEIDKSPFKGGYSPVTSALLEVLDPQQNNAFLDKYLEIPIDLSNVLFICTANDIDGVPPALRDRMEIIEFREYTVEERRTIVKDYMVPSVIKDYCLTEFPISFEDSAIEYFSSEVQLRQIELKLRKLLKRVATQIYLKQRESFVATATSIGEVFGEKVQRTNLKRIGF